MDINALDETELKDRPAAGVAAMEVETAALAMPIVLQDYVAQERTGLIVVDEINGFCTPGRGPLAPMTQDDRIELMIGETSAMARRFLDLGRPVLVFRDTHLPGTTEPPFPPHCMAGSGDELLVDRLRWLERAGDGVSFLDKDVINGVVGGIRPDGSNVVFDWVRENDLQAVVFQGICTDICILDAVVTMLSARNHRFEGEPMLGGLKDIVVHEPGCATYDLPLDTARILGLPDTAAHPQGLAHHMGLWVMQSRGAILARIVA